MSGPWEQFQSTEGESGPWNEFASGGDAAPPKKLDYGDVNKTVGVAQGAAQVLSSAAGAAAGGLAGMGAITKNTLAHTAIGSAIAKALGITDTDPVALSQKVQAALGYQAPSETGQAVASTIAAPFEWLAGKGDQVGQNVTDVATTAGASPEVAAGLGTAANVGVQAAPQIILGGVAKLGGAKLSAMESTAATKRAVVAVDEAPAYEGIKAAREAGYKVTPNEAKAGVTARSAEGLSGSAKLQKGASVDNQPNTNRLVRKDIGLPDTEAATPKAIQAIIDDAHKPYEAVKKIGPFENDAQFLSDIDDITKARDTAAESYPHRQKLTPEEQRFQDTVDGLKEASTPTTKAAVEEVKLLRSDAKKAFRENNEKLGYQYRALAEAVDASMERALGKMAETGDPALASAVAEYRAARQKIAKAYQAQDALGVDGNFDANAYARIFKKDPELLTGPALQVGKFATQFPKLVQQAQKVGHTGMDFGDLALMAFKGVRGAAGDALLLGARPATRAAILSGPVQKSLTKPPSYERPMSSRAAQLAADAQSEASVQGVEMGAGQGREDRLRYIRSLGEGQ